MHRARRAGRRAIAITATALLSLGPAAQAGAAATAEVSSNWAGYAVARSGVSFRHVSATWVQPAVRCVAGRHSYSSHWIGIGGYAATSTGLEQVGIDADCSSTGRAVYGAWYEVLPAASVAVPIAIRAGDTMSASVTISGRLVTMRLTDLTRSAGFVRRMRVARPDVSSAEWIVEAPSLCGDSGSCRIPTLADFGATTFSSAVAVSTTGHAGTIADPRWTARRISLHTDSAAAASLSASPANAGDAIPGALSGAGDTFTVTYRLGPP
jgi:hypothetical protein